MFMNADIIVKAVMIGLAFASLVTWTVWLAKSLELLAARTRAWRGAHVIVQARSLDQAAKMLGSGSNAASLLVQAASQEVELSSKALDHCGGEGLKERVASRLSRIEAQAARRMTRGTGLLATIGSTAPFVGLFGTVWGIMNAFTAIAAQKNTNLAVVAPGIAEALFATALGLVAAIPAVIAFNKITNDLGRYANRLEGFSGEFSAILSRQIDDGTK
jgi:biopolymer transport protein ExbB